MTKNVVIDENKKIETSIADEKKHIGNAKLSEAKKAIKIHFFENNKFFVIPLKEIENRTVGRVYEYSDGIPEVAGEILPPKKNSNLWTIIIKSQFYYLKDNYVVMLQNNTNLTLGIWEE